MARMNPKRRLIQRLKAEVIARHVEKVQTNAEPLQGGKVKSALSKFDNRIGRMNPPREIWEGQGRKPRKTSQRFAVDGFKWKA